MENVMIEAAEGGSYNLAAAGGVCMLTQPTSMMCNASNSLILLFNLNLFLFYTLFLF